MSLSRKLFFLALSVQFQGRKFSGTMGHLKESTYANHLIKNGTILTTMTTPTNIPIRKTTTTHTVVARKTICAIFACCLQ